MITKRLIFTFLLCASVSLHVFSQIPTGYYDQASGKSGYALKTSLYNIIKGHNDRGYSALWTLYETSDKRDDGFVWDMYSDCDLEFNNDQDMGSGGTVECDKFNREHTFPQSWFGGSGIMRNDPFHVMPTDKKVNSVRGNFAYGEVSNANYTSLNGSKLGANTIAGHSATVFEPIDMYKGDLARGYLYMATRYENVIAGWEKNDSDGDAMLNGTSDQVYEDWALEMLIAWHQADPVSQKEIDRNDAIYDFQGNRNPFIDHPEYVASIWGGGVSPTATITIAGSLNNFGSVPFGEVSASQSYTISANDLSSDISITSNNGFEVSLTDSDQSFTNSLSVSETSGVISNTTIYVRFKPQSDANSQINGILTHTSTGATTQNVAVSGTEHFEFTPELNFNFTFRSIGEVEQYEVGLYADAAPNDDLSVIIEKTNNTNMDYGLQYTTVPSIVSDQIELNWTAGELNTSFTIDLDWNQINTSVLNDVKFALKASDGYTVGVINEFELKLKTSSAITAVPMQDATKLLLYPNPTDELVNIIWTDHQFQYIIRDLAGKTIVIGDGNASKELDISKFKSGHYFISIWDDNDRVTQKLMIR